jgi:hypothetical protein
MAMKVVWNDSADCAVDAMAPLLILAIPTPVGFSKPLHGQPAQPSGHILWHNRFANSIGNPIFPNDSDNHIKGF